MWMNFLCFYLFARLISSELSGDHICPEEERYIVNVTRYLTRNITIRNYQWCLQVPPRCSTYIVKEVNGTVTVEEERVRQVNKCCVGYREDNLREKCTILCENCANGKCGADQLCDCEPGYEGPNCSEACERNRWGKSCRNQCRCERGTCDARTGECVCPPRWNGTRCETCSEGHLGEQCDCNCSTTAVCDPTRGECVSVSANEPKTNASQQDNGTRATEDLTVTDVTDRDVSGNLSLVKSKIAFDEEPVSQKYHAFDLTTPKDSLYATRVSRKYFPTKYATRKKSTSLPYSYFTTHIYHRGSLYNFKTYLTNSFSTTTLPTTKQRTSSIEKDDNKPDLSMKTSLETILTDVTTIANFVPSTYNNLSEANNYAKSPDAEVNPAADSTRTTLRDYDENKQELTPVNIKTEQPANVTQLRAQKAKVFEAGVSSRNAGHAREERFLNDESQLEDDPLDLQQNGGLLFSVLSAVLVTTVILMTAGVLLAYVKIRRRKLLKIKSPADEKEVANAMSTVSVTTRSIFHTPLPDPPVFENPVFTTPMENNANNPTTTFEAHVVCSVNFPKQASYLRDGADLFYDHPPSTGSYRAASIPEPPDAENERNLSYDPIYDEIPCGKKLVPTISPPPLYATDNVSLYVNTKKS